MTTAQLTRDGELAILTIDNPPVNAVGPALVADLSKAIDAFEADATPVALVIECAGRTFVAGGDIASFENPDFSAAPFNAVLDRIEASSRPVVAALFGSVLGGGLELALACHGRVAHPETRFGMPEITLGLIPGSLGTQRLPRLAGIRMAAQMISSGKSITADAALAAGIVDRLDADQSVSARDEARRLATTSAPPRQTRHLPISDTETADDVLGGLRGTAEKSPWLPALRSVAESLGAAVTLPYEEGEAVEARHFRELVGSPQSRSMRHLFFAEREAQKIPGMPANVTPREVSSIGIVGAGTMGTGITISFLSAGFPVTLIDTTEAALDRGRAAIAAAYASSVKRGRLTDAQVGAHMGRLSLSTELAALGRCDMVVEAVFEDMALKLEVARQLSEICKPGAIIATNTSTLDVDDIAAATDRAGDVIGTHFFSPAHIMRLLEVVRGAKTAPAVLATIMKIARRIGKTAVVSGVCYGFIGNRMAEVYMRENEALQLEGASPTRIDGVVQSPAFLGMAMGPSRMLDMAGVDVGARTVIEWINGGDGPKDPAYRILCRTLYERGWYGQKSGNGYYLYKDRKPVHSNETEALATSLAQEHGITRRSEIPEQEIFERLLYPMVNEAAAILEEGIAYRPGDIDVVWTAGYGFPAWRGGPIFMADEIGLSNIVARLDHHGERHGNNHGYWTVSPLLRQLAKDGKRLSDWRRSN